jgi:hypothetical protein
MRIAFLVALGLLGCGGGKGVDSSTCHGLAQSACQQTTGCVPDTCAGCGCDVNYRGCLAEGETPAMCPQLGCPSGICCSADHPCASGTGMCFSPGESIGCGACRPDPNSCNTDADCKPMGQTMVCDPIECSCMGNKACTQGCTNDMACGEGTHCDLPTARCVALSCSAATPCPANFSCTSGACARTTCNMDSDCDGFCVNGGCFAGRGMCTFPPP